MSNSGSPRPRHEVAPALIVLLRPLLRYSSHRDAYVLRLIGHRHGPVLRRRARATTPEPTERLPEPVERLTSGAGRG